MVRWIPVALAALALSAGSPARGGEGLDAGIAGLPGDTTTAIIVPELDRLDDELETWLEGMDRAGLLLGADPLEHMLALAGIPLHVNEEAPLIAARQSGGAWTILVPVTDADAFLSGNFEPGGSSGTWATAAGRAWRVRRHEQWVALADPAAAPADLIGSDGVAAWWTRVAPDREGRLDASDLFVVGDLAPLAAAAASGLRRFTAWSAGGANATTDLAARAFGNRAAAVAIDFDPLALVIRAWATFGDDTPAAARGASIGPGGLDRLPRRPFLAAGSVDLTRFRAVNGIDLVAEALDRFVPTASMRMAQSIQGVAFQAPAGRGAGILNDAMALVETDDPDGAMTVMRDWVMDRRDQNDGFTRVVRWEDEVEIDDGGPAHAFEIRLTGVPEGAESTMLLHRLFFGPMGARGLVAPVPSGVAVTSRGRGEGTLRALRGSAGGTDEHFGADPIITAMRGWLPPARDVEAYLDAGAVVRRLTRSFEGDPLLGRLPLPSVDADLPPIALGADLAAGEITSTVILPAAVVAVLLDWLPKIRPDGWPGAEDHPRESLP